MNTQQKIWQLVNQRGVIPDVSQRKLYKQILIKLDEEVEELWRSFHITKQLDPFEIADVYIVICNAASAINIDIESIALAKASADVYRKPK